MLTSQAILELLGRSALPVGMKALSERLKLSESELRPELAHLLAANQIAREPRLGFRLLYNWEVKMLRPPKLKPVHPSPDAQADDQASQLRLPL